VAEDGVGGEGKMSVDDVQAEVMEDGDD